MSGALVHVKALNSALLFLCRHSPPGLQRISAAVILACFFPLPLSAQVPAFPGALGFGANATGGRGGSVCHVTTLADSGAGSFRTAVSSPNRIVVFDVGGYINLLSAVSVRENITIAGQTAPGGGIGFKGGEISFASRNNIICRFIRIRPGSDTASNTDDALSLYRTRNVILDHVSMEFAPWNNVGAVSDDWQNWPVTDVTFQHCINANPTYQQFGAHTESVSSTMAWYACVFANSHNRNPLSKINDVFVNNVLYNCSAGYTTHTSTSFDHDIVNNYFIAGPASDSNLPWYQVDSNQSIYCAGDYYDSDKNGVLGGGLTTPYWYQGVGTVLDSPWSALTPTVPTYTAATAYRVAISQAGTLPRDSMDDLVMNQVKTLGNAPAGTGAGTAGPDGGLYTSQTQTGLGNNGYGTINGGVAPLDTDGDGLPDYWEKSIAGLNVSISDAMTIGADGYANIERYINWLADPHALTVTNTAVDVDLWLYTSGFTNANPVYSVTALSNGVVTLSGGHLARFTPAAGFAGLGAFRFSVSASDGTRYTNVVSVLASPMVPPSNLIWQGDGTANLWANGSGLNWLRNGRLVAFNSGDSVTLDDTGSNTPAINLSGPLVAGTVYVLASQDYTFAGGGFLSGATLLFKTGNGTLFLNTPNTATGGAVINDGIVQIGDGASANGNLGGSITNNDTLIFANPAALTSSAAISGTGTLTKNGAGALTLTGNQSFTNLTTINAGTLEFSGSPPQGDITNRGVLEFKPAGLTVCPGAISGPGSVVNNGSGTVYLAGANSFTGGLTNTTGNLVLSNNSAAGTGPVIYTAGSVMVGGGCVITNDFSIPGGGTSDLSMQGTNGTGIWAGNVVNLGSGASWRPGADTGGALVFTGTAIQGARNFIVPRGSVQFSSNAVVSATGTATAFGRDGTGGNRSASVTLRDNAVITLGVCNLGGNLAGGNVTLTIQNNAVLNCGANGFDLQNVNRATAQTFIRLNGGTMTVGGFTKSKSAQTNVIQFNGGVLKAGANNAAFLPAFTVSSNWVQSGGARIDDGGFAITIATPLIHDPSISAGIDGLTKLGMGTLTLAGVNTYTGPTTISAGTLALSAAAAINSSSGICLADAGSFDSSAVGTYTLGSGKKLWGNGAVNGSFTLGNGAVLEPGLSGIGRLTFSNVVTFAANSTNSFQLTKSPLTNDVVLVRGNLTYGGTLVVTHLSGTPGPGDSFKLFDAATYAGSFSALVLPELNAGQAWDTSGLSKNGTLAVISLAPPVISSLAPLPDGSIRLVFSGQTGQSYELRATTNVLLAPLTSWSLLSSGIFGASPITFDDVQATNSPSWFYRLRLP